MSHGITSSGPGIASLSTDSLPPGDYGWFSPSGRSDVPSLKHLQDMRSFRTMQREGIEKGIIYPELGDPRKLVQKQVRQRDQNLRLFTGELPKGMTGLCWIIPPYFSRSVFPATDMFRPSGLSLAEMTVTSNCTVMHKDLIPYFLDNAFSVDIADNYRIIVFHDMGTVRRLLPKDMSPPLGFETLKFLEAHFYSSLRANILHRDVRDEYGIPAIEDLMDELGVGSEDEDEMVPLSDPAPGLSSKYALPEPSL
ncbi:hypothetical protein EV421DRAFT_1935520 [Armillaria borealis]|uniref:Uncharacterized protein n=1 Tax=Armillaria borealis TaxID=47425 RepID=A0AA39ME48_9AGAR|nr:hypothetical protein EV421DRAFT_1935520 [Armillaria borealis]